MLSPSRSLQRQWNVCELASCPVWILDKKPIRESIVSLKHSPSSTCKKKIVEKKLDKPARLTINWYLDLYLSNSTKITRNTETAKLSIRRNKLQRVFLSERPLFPIPFSVPCPPFRLIPHGPQHFSKIRTMDTTQRHNSRTQLGDTTT